MTREEFVARHSDQHLARIMRAATMDRQSALFARWLAAQVTEVDAWLGQLHDSLIAELEKGKAPEKPQLKVSGR